VALTGRPSQIRCGTDPHELPYGCAIETELVGDRSNRQTSDTERMDLGVTMFIPNLNSAQRREGRYASLFIERRQFVGRALFVQWRQYAHSHSLKSIHQVVNDVPTIGHLHGIRSTTPRRAGIHAISIAADHLCARVFGQPANQRFCGWVLKKVDDVVIVTVDHNRAVAAAAAKGEFIDPENLGRLNRWFG